MKLVAVIKSFLFGKDLYYRVNYITNNKNKIDINKIHDLRVPKTLVVKNNSLMTISIILKNLKEIKIKLDEDSYNPISLQLSCNTYTNETIGLIDMIVHNNIVYPNYRDELIECITLYRDIRLLVDGYGKKDLTDMDLAFNCNLFNLYIITMESIIDNIYNSIL